MQKLMLIPVLLYAGCVISGLYGALHNQISYTVSPNFFHWEMFPRFNIPVALQNRVGAAMVGWKSSWWMGLLIGAPILLVGLILPGWRVYLTRCLIAFGIVAATTLIVGMGALAYAEHYRPEQTPFDHAGMMHNFSYLGGFIGIITGSTYLIVERVRLSLRIARQAQQADQQVTKP